MSIELSAEECVIQLADSTSLRSPAYPEECRYIRRCFLTGEEIAGTCISAEEVAADAQKALDRLLRLADDPTGTTVDTETGDEYPEVIHDLADGGTIRLPAHGDPCEYVRIFDDDGVEEVYWHYNEFEEDPEVVLGALMGSLNTPGFDD